MKCVPVTLHWKHSTVIQGKTIVLQLKSIVLHLIYSVHTRVQDKVNQLSSVSNTLASQCKHLSVHSSVQIPQKMLRIVAFFENFMATFQDF